MVGFSFTFIILLRLLQSHYQGASTRDDYLRCWLTIKICSGGDKLSLSKECITRRWKVPINFYHSILVVDNPNDIATFFLQSHRSADSQGVHGTWGNCEAMEAEDTSSANIRGFSITLLFFLPCYLAVNNKCNSANNTFRLYSRQRSSRRGLNLLLGRNLSSVSISKFKLFSLFFICGINW